MRVAAIFVTMLAFTGAGLTQASAQSSSATSGGIGGQNTIQQAPSGGRAGGGGAGGATAAPTGGAAGAQPTEADRKTEEHNKSVTQICKGC